MNIKVIFAFIIVAPILIPVAIVMAPLMLLFWATNTVMDFMKWDVIDLGGV